MTSEEKIDKLFLKLHDLHNFRESHIKTCKACRYYFNLYDELLRLQKKIDK
jgi:predicted anti-sigma-YlaC factor YlaD